MPAPPSPRVPLSRIGGRAPSRHAATPSGPRTSRPRTPADAHDRSRPRTTADERRRRRPRTTPTAAPTTCGTRAWATRSNGRSPFMWGLFGGLGALVAIWLGLHGRADRRRPDAGRRGAVPRGRAQPGGGVPDASRAEAALGGARRDPRRGPGVRGLPGDPGPGDHRPGRRDQRQRSRAGSTSSSATQQVQELDDKYDIIEQGQGLRHRRLRPRRPSAGRSASGWRSSVPCPTRSSSWC